MAVAEVPGFVLGGVVFDGIVAVVLGLARAVEAGAL